MILESNVGDVPKGYQLVILGTSIFSGSQFNYVSGANSAIVYNSRFNSGSAFYSFNTSPTSSYSLELNVNEALEISSIEQLVALKLYNPSGSTYNVNLTTEFFS